MMKKLLRKSFDLMCEKYFRTVRRKRELLKFSDNRRRRLYESIHLSKEQKDEVDSLYEKCYGEKIPYIWHRHYTAFSGSFDKFYFPELLYIPELERYLNIYSNYSKVFSDKNVIPFVAESSNVNSPRILFSRNKGMYRDSNNERIDSKTFFEKISNVGECFIKPSVDSNSGKMCFLSYLKNGYDENNDLSVESLFSNLGNDFVVQEKITCHSSLTQIYSKSVNTFRVISYRWKDCIYTVPSVMRIGRGGHFLDNAHAGGIFVAINDDGTLHKKAFTEFKQEFLKHPDTDFVFANSKISCFPQILIAAKKMHEKIPQIGIVNWDFTINEVGKPVIIEGNMMGGGIWLPQMAHGKGPFGERTPEILEWMRKMRSYSLNEKKKFAFGAE